MNTLKIHMDNLVESGSLPSIPGGLAPIFTSLLLYYTETLKSWAHAGGTLVPNLKRCPTFEKKLQNSSINVFIKFELRNTRLNFTFDLFDI